MKQFQAVKILGWALGVALPGGMALAQAASYAQDIQWGNGAYAQRNYQQASAYYQAAIALDPNNWTAYQGLGNCLYAQGNSAAALADYQKALNLNPSNAQLVKFVEGLEARMGITTPSDPPARAQDPAPGSAAGGAAKAASSNGSPELDLHAGLAMGSATGFGGGAMVFFPLDRNFSLGGSAAFYAFDSGASETESTGYGTVSAGGSSSTSVVEMMLTGKYAFDGSGARPYILAGAGAAYMNASASAGGSAGSGGVSVTENLNESGSQVDPMLTVGGGVEVPLGNNLNFYGQARLVALIQLGGSTENVSGSSNEGGSISGSASSSGGGTTTYIPIEAGISLGL